jgi:hypothetical protein
MTTMKHPRTLESNILLMLWEIRRDLQNGIIVPTDERLLPIIQRLQVVEEGVSLMATQSTRMLNRHYELIQAGQTLATQKQAD